MRTPKICVVCGVEIAFPRKLTCGDACATAHMKHRDHERNLKRLYGVDATEYAGLLAIQGGRCAICGNRPRKQRLAMDHNHRDGTARGLLCSRCNHTLLGGARESVDILRSAIAYLNDPPAYRLYERLDES